MKTTITQEFDPFEQQTEIRCIVNAAELYSAICEIDEIVRRAAKDKPTEEVYDLTVRIRELTCDVICKIGE